VIEVWFRIAWMAVQAARRSDPGKAARFAAEAVRLHRDLRQTHTAAQMGRFDKMLMQLELGKKQ
jgi:hypothetical protein